MNQAPLILLAPMEGVIDAVTRAIYSRIGGFDRFVTEFIRVTSQRLPANVFYDYCPELKTNGRTAEGVPVFVQLLGGNPQVVAENAAFAVLLGAPGIDLNFGCPAPTVNRHDGGAAILKNPHRLFDIISAVRAAVPQEIPVTAKVRLGFSDKNSVLEIARAVDEAKASMLTVHARTRDEGYKPPAHWEYIAKIRESIQTPVVANGDIWTVRDYVRCREVSGCADVALGRSAMATPDLALQIRAFLKNEVYAKYEWSFVRETLLAEFIETSRNLIGDPRTLGRTKQWLRMLKGGYREVPAIFESAKQTKSIESFMDSLKGAQIN